MRLLRRLFAVLRAAHAEAQDRRLFNMIQDERDARRSRG
jgi:hypothetical protein